MLFVTNLCETALLLKTVKPMLYLGNVLLLRYILSYNLVVSFNFHLTFLQLSVIKMFIVQEKLFFPFSRQFSSSFQQLKLFLISLEGSSYGESSVL